MSQVGDVHAGPKLAFELRGDSPRRASPGVDQKDPDRVAMGAGRDVVAIGEEEAVAWRRGKFLSDRDVVESHRLVAARAGVLKAQRDPVTGAQLEVVDGLRADDEVVRAL